MSHVCNVLPVIGRSRDLFVEDIKRAEPKLSSLVRASSFLVIGGAGSLGSSYIKAMLRYEPARLYVIDISENGLTELIRDLRSTHRLKVPQQYKAYPIKFGDSIFDRILNNEGPFDIVANFAARALRIDIRKRFVKRK